MEIAFTPENAGLIVAVAKGENFKVLSSVIDESIRRAAEAREQSQAARADREAREARADRVAQIEKQERETAQAVAERRRAELERQAAESVVRKLEIRQEVWQGPIDLAA